MVSKRQLNLFLISIPLFIAHGTEEYLTRFFLLEGASWELVEVK